MIIFKHYWHFSGIDTWKYWYRTSIDTCIKNIDNLQVLLTSLRYWYLKSIDTGQLSISFKHWHFSSVNTFKVSIFFQHKYFPNLHLIFSKYLTIVLIPIKYLNYQYLKNIDKWNVKMLEKYCSFKNIDNLQALLTFFRYWYLKSIETAQVSISFKHLHFSSIDTWMYQYFQA